MGEQAAVVGWIGLGGRRAVVARAEGCGWHPSLRGPWVVRGPGRQADPPAGPPGRSRSRRPGVGRRRHRRAWSHRRSGQGFGTPAQPSPHDSHSSRGCCAMHVSYPAGPSCGAGVAPGPFLRAVRRMKQGADEVPAAGGTVGEGRVAGPPRRRVTDLSVELSGRHRLIPAEVRGHAELDVRVDSAAFSGVPILVDARQSSVLHNAARREDQ